MPPLRICQVVAELAPLAKTGGLGDVTAALARYLPTGGADGDSEAQVDVRVVMPFYESLPVARADCRRRPELLGRSLELGAYRYEYSVLETEAPGGAPLFLVDCPELYGRPEIYTGDEDEPRRFLLLTRAAIETCRLLGWAPDVFHAHDWHAGMLPLLLRTAYAGDKVVSGSRTLLTIHNIGYQGVFERPPVADLQVLENPALLDLEELRGGEVNFLRSGILHADRLTTVSPTHAKEIQTAEYGCGLDALLRERRDDLTGILNGVDYREWDPRHDPLIYFRYSPDELAGKERCREVLLADQGLAATPRVPLVGVVSRLAHQKGIDLMMEALPEVLATEEMQLVVLGSGESRFEEFFRRLAADWPGRVAFHGGFDNELAHQIEAGSDIFLMPSLYEPCGLNQMYSLRYGTVPVVRRTGGLADSVAAFDPASDSGTGFLFDEKSGAELAVALRRALAAFGEREAWRRLMIRGMESDFSWETQVETYRSIYRQMAGG